MGEKVVIDLDQALKLLLDAREERGYDYIDPGSEEGRGCYNVIKDYTDDEGNKLDEPVLCPSCIAGTVFSYAGVPLEFLYKHNGTVNSTVRAIADDLTEEFEVTPEAAAVLRVAQRAQDKGESWGAAVEAAHDIAAAFRGEEH